MAAKYRRLSIDELKELETEFKQFLISNNLYDEEWKTLNNEFPEKAIELVDLFSDLVMEKAIKNIKYIAHVSSDSLYAFWYREDMATLVALSSDGVVVNFQNENWMKILSENKGKIQVFKTEKEIVNRTVEIFELLKKGGQLIDVEYFKIIYQLSESS